MKIFKYFTYLEIKEISKKLYNNSCYFRHPKSDLVKYLGQETIDKLVEIGFLKDSPSTGKHWDYKEDCYEFTRKFKNIFSFIILPFWIWFKYNVLHIAFFKHIWQKIRIKCGHHYDWQDYEGVDLNDI